MTNVETNADDHGDAFSTFLVGILRMLDIIIGGSYWAFSSGIGNILFLLLYWWA